jgi:hypothetical protein
VQSRPIAVAEPDDEVRSFLVRFVALDRALELGVFALALELDLNAAMLGVKMIEAGQQPICRQRRRQMQPHAARPRRRAHVEAGTTNGVNGRLQI